jgi:hypothetical protein
LSLTFTFNYTHYELLPEVSEAMIQGAMIRLMLQRLGERQKDA